MNYIKTKVLVCYNGIGINNDDAGQLDTGSV